MEPEKSKFISHLVGGFLTTSSGEITSSISETLEMSKMKKKNQIRVLLLYYNTYT